MVFCYDDCQTPFVWYHQLFPGHCVNKSYTYMKYHNFVKNKAYNITNITQLEEVVNREAKTSDDIEKFKAFDDSKPVYCLIVIVWR